VLRRKGALAPFLVLLAVALIWPHCLFAAEKKARKPGSSSSPSAQAVAGVNDINLLDYFQAGEEQLKKGRTDDALRAFLGVYAYTRDNLVFMKCVGDAYEKALNDPNLKQSQKEDLYLKLQRINGLSNRYFVLKGESAYNIGLLYKKKGDAEQARKYLLETCQTVPFSPDPASVWMKSKNLLLSLAGLEGTF
jgi:tetratricopeptide (TPR) repeat protein